MQFFIAHIVAVCIVAMTVFGIPDSCLAKALFIDLPGDRSAIETRVRTAADFYGMEFLKLEFRDKIIENTIVDALRGSRKSLIFINARSLSQLSKEEILKALFKRKKAGNDTTLVILGIHPNIEKNDLHKWSAGAIESSQEEKNHREAYLNFSDMREIAHSFSGQKKKISIEQLISLKIGNREEQMTIMSMAVDEYAAGLPVMIKTNMEGFDVFHISEMNIKSHGGESGSCETEYLHLLPVLISLRYGCGEYCWHSTGIYANLTIDDPFLVEPYGFLNYEGLLKEMQAVQFHTTIAFIPWNYDRSEIKVVEIMRRNPDKYSIAVHGSEHDFREFQGKGMKDHEAKIRRALARMEAFKDATGLEYDRVMIFPRDLGSREALQAVKKMNFLGTANWNNTPDGAGSNPEAANCLKQIIADVGGFPALKRYGPHALSAFDIASLIYLEMPLLFRVHHGDFEAGNDAFTKTAAKVNSLDPDVVWMSIGNIFRHLYVQKRRDDGNWDVRTYSNRFVLGGRHKKGAVYHVTKADDLDTPIASVTVGGKEIKFMTGDKTLTFSIHVPSYTEQEISIEYEQEHDPESILISKNDFWVGINRWFAEFRDRRLVKSYAGKVLVGVVYADRQTRLHLLFIMAIMAGIFIVCLRIKMISRRK
jgi:hypothetical protein